MPWFDIFMTDITEAKIVGHGLTYADVESAVLNPNGQAKSDSSGRPMLFGYAVDGRKIAVIYEMIDRVTIEIITAYEAK